MSEIIIQSSLPVPCPKEEISIRIATVEDIPFIDAMQKRYRNNVGFLRKKAIEGKISRNEVLVAETGGRVSSPAGNCDNEGGGWGQPPSMLGYLIGQDRYLKRDDLGIIFQLVVSENAQRGYVGAALLRAQFERSAYGCRLYCCWCAQDLAANRFYESMGFVPLAFRAGSTLRLGSGQRARVHIFWQKRICDGDAATPWWYPSMTSGGALQADRLAFPIPPGKHWSDEMPIILPPETNDRPVVEPVSREKTDRAPRRKIPPKVPGVQRPEDSELMMHNGLRFTPDQEEPMAGKPKSKKQSKQKMDGKYVSAARELRDRYLERVNQNPQCLMSAGKYNLTKQIAGNAQPMLGVA